MADNAVVSLGKYISKIIGGVAAYGFCVAIWYGVNIAFNMGMTPNTVITAAGLSAAIGIVCILVRN